MRPIPAIIVLGLLLVVGPACSFGAPSAGSSSSAAQPSPTLLPPPKPISSPEAAGPASASPSPAIALATPIPAPAVAAGSPAAGAAGERVRVANTGGDGANMRAEPATTGALVRTIKEGTELDVVGADREAGGRRWRNVRETAGDVSGWIVADFLTPVTAGASGAPPAPPAAPPAAAPSPAAPAAGTPPAGSPAPAGGAQSGPAQRIGEADRAYLAVLQPQVDALGKAITAANEQIERAGGRPDILSDPTWRQDTSAVVQSLSDAAAKIRAATPGPATGEVARHAASASDHASAAAAALTSASQSGDARNLSAVRTELVRVLAEINNMNLSLLNLQ